MSEITPVDIPKFDKLGGYETLSGFGALALSVTFLKPLEITPIFHPDEADAAKARIDTLNGRIDNLQTTKHVLKGIGPIPSRIHTALDAKIADREAQVQDIRTHSPVYGNAEKAGAITLGFGTVILVTGAAVAASHYIRKAAYKRRYPVPPKSPEEPRTVGAEF